MKSVSYFKLIEWVAVIVDVIYVEFNPKKEENRSTNLNGLIGFKLRIRLE